MAEDLEAVERLKDRIRQRIFSAELPAGARLAEDELRRESGATFRVVRAALKDLTDEGLLQRRQRVGTFVAKKLPEPSGGHRLPELTAVGLVSGLGRRSFGDSTYISAIREGIDAALAPGAKVELFLNEDGVSHGLGSVPPLPEALIKDQLQGLIVLEANNVTVLEDLVRRGIPVVAVDFQVARHTWDAVCIDHVDAGFQATRHLLELGHRRIAFAGERPNPGSADPTWQDRHLGYVKAMAAVSRDPFGAWLLDTNRDHTTIRHRMLKFHREVRPTAYVLASSGFLVEALAALGELGLSCPEDVSLAGVDGGTRYLDTQTVSTVRGPYEDLGRMAARLLASRLACPAMPPVRVMLPVDFAPGVTTAVPKA